MSTLFSKIGIATLPTCSVCPCRRLTYFFGGGRGVSPDIVGLKEIHNLQIILTDNKQCKKIKIENVRSFQGLVKVKTKFKISLNRKRGLDFGRGMHFHR